jgi:DNA-binding transcriptional LysR family regulator
VRKAQAPDKPVEGFFERHKISVLKKMELTSNEAVKQALIAGLGYSIMPLIGIKNELLNEELHIVPIPGLPITTTWRLIWLKGKKHSPAAQSFLAFLKKKSRKLWRRNSIGLSSISLKMIAFRMLRAKDDGLIGNIECRLRLLLTGH